MIYLFVVEAPVEVVPKELWGEKSVVMDSKRLRRSPRDILLNVSRHYEAMKKHNLLYRRGRPDIAHLTLITALDSPLNRIGQLRIFVQTVDGNVIRVSPDVRLPRAQDRFEGLIVKLLKDGCVPRKPPILLELVGTDLPTLMEPLMLDRVVAFSRMGSHVNLEDFLGAVLMKPNVGFMVGGFQEDNFSPNIAALADETVSVSNFPLSAHLVVCKLLSESEKFFEKF